MLVLCTSKNSSVCGIRLDYVMGRASLCDTLRLASLRYVVDCSTAAFCLESPPRLSNSNFRLGQALLTNVVDQTLSTICCPYSLIGSRYLLWVGRSTSIFSPGNERNLINGHLQCHANTTTSFSEALPSPSSFWQCCYNSSFLLSRSLS